ncbi:MAG: alpha-galactosidase [Ignavibacteriaceae bacterium]|nr:alpha-galactosidase [Ignavibacteriaceae bacterium]
MLKKILAVSFFIMTSVLTAQNTAYIKKDGEQIKIGNRFIERVINTSAKNVGTIKIENKVSGQNYDVKSDEYALQIVSAGGGPAYGKEQHGDNPVILTAKDFKYTDFKESELENGGKKLTLNFHFSHEVEDFYLNINYTVFPGDFYMRKWIEVSDSSYGVQFLDKIYVESMTFSIKDFSRAQFGQPVFNKDIFLGVEYPTVFNEIDGNKVRCGYVVGENIKKDAYVSNTSIIGISPSSVKLEQTFMEYVDKIKINGTRPYLLYNSWYDFRNPAVVNDSESVMNEKSVLARIDTFKKYMTDKYNITLDAFVLDDGWDKYQSMWGIDSSRFPNGFKPFTSALANTHTGLGMWSSPFCGYDHRDIRVKWGFEHGYEKVGDFLCFAGTNYKAAFKKAFVDYTKEYNIGYYKWDGFPLACNELNHGHLPGVYSREAYVSTYIDIMNSVRKVNPNIFLNITTGTWLSPWWLKYADCIWMQGADWAYSEEVPSLNDRDKSITYRDAVLWDDLQKQQLLFPMSSLMTHGIIKGRLNFLGGKDELLDSFTNEIMMYFGRGVMMWELYVSPDLLSDNEWNAIASSIKWAKANKDVLEKTKMILGEPLKREPYGYIHLTNDKGILLLRNPNVDMKEVKIKLSPDLGEVNESEKYFVKIIYPYNMILPNPVGINQEIKVNLDGYEVLTAELIPSNKIDKNLPVGIRYSVNNNNLIVYGEPANIKTVGSKIIGTAKTKGSVSKIMFDKNTQAINKGNVYESNVNVNIPSGYNNTKFAFLLEPDTKLQKELKPDMEINVNGVSEKLQVEEENGKWFWALTDLKQGENKVSYKISFKSKTNGKISSWIIADKELKATEIKSISVTNEQILPAKPYAENIQKVLISIKKDNL